ncbi:MAG: glucose-6-phosphate dehydrogenase assembly protein OpcA [Acidobacteria bacterium]|nr:glucose-6-phosphate dehydrogenase assembly protein OpcA [Acidobacteriota bacterium]
MSAGVAQPERILKDLADLWGELGKTERHGVLRACAMTFVIVLDASEDATAIGETLAALTHEFPSRLIVVRLTQGDHEVLQTNVTAQCWMPFGLGQQICCEQIEITATRATLEDVPVLINGLTVPDLPVVLYCRNPRLLLADDFRLLLPLADRLILDSGLESERAILDGFNGLRRPKLQRADLAWTRLTPWREAVAQIFDHPAQRRRVYAVQDIRILYAGADDPIAVYYLAGWFMHVLGAGVHIHIARGVGPEYGSIARVTLEAPDQQVSLELLAGATVEVDLGEDLSQRIVFPDNTEYAVLREELSIGVRDVIFEDVLGLAALMKSAA